MRKILFVYLFLMNISNIFASKEFNIAPVKQEKNLWCWAASSEMVLDAYKYNTDQYDCANFAVAGQNATNVLFGTRKSVDQVLSNFGSISTKYDLSTLFGNILIGEIDAGKPIIAGVKLSGNIGHVVVIRGYTGSGGSDVGDVIFNDPGTGTRRRFPYADFVQTGTSWSWNETLRLITSPRTPIPIGFYDYCYIYNDGTTTITPSTTSLSYSALFSRRQNSYATPVSWSWKLILTDINGEYIVNSWSYNSTSMYSNWNISGFSLPFNSWYYNSDGKIPGRVVVEVLDSDGYHHLDNVGVTYVPANLYPGTIIYENNTVSSAQPEVKAHQIIYMNNDQFLSGGNITFRAGERIDIRDGITVQNGSSINFTIDRSVR